MNVSNPEINALSRNVSVAFLCLAVAIGFGAAQNIDFLARPPATYLVVLMAFGALLITPRYFVKHLFFSLSFALFAAWMVASWAWTLNPTHTFLTLRTELALALAAAVVLAMLPTRDITTWYTRAFQVVVLISIIMTLLVPESRAGASEQGVALAAWRAGFNHKNGLATAMAIAIPWLLTLRNRNERIISVTLACLLILGSRSVTGLLGGTMAIMTWWWLQRVRQQPTVGPNVLMIATVPVIGLLALGIWSSFTSVALALGKDPTLTGRTEIWRGALEVARSQPLLGFGPGGVFEGPLSTETLQLWAIAEHAPSHAHNGFLQVQLDLGLVGVMLVVALLCMSSVDASRIFRYDPATAICVLSSVAVLLVMASSESVFTGAGWLVNLAVLRVLTLRRRHEYLTDVRSAALRRRAYPRDSRSIARGPV